MQEVQIIFTYPSQYFERNPGYTFLVFIVHSLFRVEKNPMESSKFKGRETRKYVFTLNADCDTGTSTGFKEILKKSQQARQPAPNALTMGPSLFQRSDFKLRKPQKTFSKVLIFMKLGDKNPKTVSQCKDHLEVSIHILHCIVPCATASQACAPS